MANLETSYLGLKLKNPLVIASSGLTNSVKKIKELEEAGAAAVVVKSIFEEQILNELSSLLEKEAHNASYPEAEDYMKTYLRDNTVSSHLNLIREAKEAVSIPVIASINCVSTAEWTTFAKDFEEAGADALELNVFYVPTEKDKKSGEIEQVYLDILAKVKKEVSIPVVVKIGMYFTNLVGMTEKLKANGASGVVLFNRFYEPDINLKTLKLTSSEIFSNPGDLRRSLRWTGLISSKVKNIDIASSTGIHDGSAVLKQLLAGAQVAQLCSVIYQNGTAVIGKMLEEIEDFMKVWNFKKIDDFKSRLSYDNIPDPMLYERSQFMKYFSSRE